MGFTTILADMVSLWYGTVMKVAHHIFSVRQHEVRAYGRGLVAMLGNRDALLSATGRALFFSAIPSKKSYRKNK